jgi:predicted permease
MTLTSIAQDLRYGLRTLIRTPGFTAIAVAVLALGIGATVTVFSLANAFFLRPLPVSAVGDLVRVCSNRFSTTSLRSFTEYRDRNSTLAGLAGFQLRSFGLRIDQQTEHTFGEIVSGDYFSILGVSPARGRVLTASDDRTGAAPVVVLSHAYWTRRFGASPDAIGRTIALNDEPFTIVGVAAERFTGVMAPLRGDLWLPLAADAMLRPALDADTRAETLSMHLMGRLRPDADLARAQADLDAIGQQLRLAAGQRETGPAVTVYPGTVLHPEISTPVAAFTSLLMVVVMLVLLIVCVNVANLVLARAAGRGAELAIRQSVGAGRGRLVRQLLTESLLLAIAGAAGGLAIAYWATQLVGNMSLPAPVPVALDLGIDIRVLAFTTLAAIAATLAFGMAPALSASKVDLVASLKGTAGGGLRHSRLRAFFLTAQVSMSVLVLITAGLFIRGFRQAQSMDLGFDAAHILTASIDLETRGYSEARGRDFIRTLVQRLDTTPGIVSANALDIVPVTLSNRIGHLLREGDTDPAEGQPLPPPAYMNVVGPGHFKTMQITMLSGRDFTDRDDDRSPQVAIVNETLARRFWPGANAVGQRLRPLRVSDPRQALEVIGVVRDSKYVTHTEEPRPFIYRPLAQNYTPLVTLLVRTAGAPGSALPALIEAVRAQDAGVAVFNVATMTDATAISLLPTRIAGNLLGALGMLALALAALGIYGVLSFIVRARAHEIGVRLAIGAAPREVAALVVRQAMRWTATGGAIGLALALALTRFLGVFLGNISPTDPWTFAGVTLLLMLVAGLAALAPARRASRVDPLLALRSM